MGQIIKITCTACRSGWELRTGCGILHGDLMRVAALYPPEQCREIRSYANKEEYPLFSFGYQPAFCAHCNSMGSVPVLKLQDNKTYVGTCGHCRKEVMLIEDLTKVRCPVCRHAKLQKERVGAWD